MALSDILPNIKIINDPVLILPSGLQPVEGALRTAMLYIDPMNYRTDPEQEIRDAASRSHMAHARDLTILFTCYVGRALSTSPTPEALAADLSLNVAHCLGNKIRLGTREYTAKEFAERFVRQMIVAGQKKSELSLDNLAGLVETVYRNRLTMAETKPARFMPLVEAQLLQRSRDVGEAAAFERRVVSGLKLLPEDWVKIFSHRRPTICGISQDAMDDLRTVNFSGATRNPLYRTEGKPHPEAPIIYLSR